MKNTLEFLSCHSQSSKKKNLDVCVTAMKGLCFSDTNLVIRCKAMCILTAVLKFFVSVLLLLLVSSLEENDLKQLYLRIKGL